MTEEEKKNYWRYKIMPGLVDLYKKMSEVISIKEADDFKEFMCKQGKWVSEEEWRKVWEELTKECNHDIEDAQRVSRAKWICPLCKKDVSLEYVLYQEMLHLYQ